MHTHTHAHTHTIFAFTNKIVDDNGSSTLDKWFVGLSCYLALRSMFGLGPALPSLVRKAHRPQLLRKADLWVLIR